MTIILFHGLPSLASVWEPMLPLLPPDTRALELIDRSGPPASLSETLEAAVVQCRALPGPLTVVGHSSGAWLALRVAARLPERVERAVCLAGCSEMPEQHGREMLGFAEALESGALTLDSASEIASQRWFVQDADYERNSVAARHFFEAMGVSSVAWALRLSFEMSQVPQLPARSVREVVVVHGLGDQAVPLALGQAAKPAAQSYREVLLDTASHFLQWSHSQAVADAVLR